MAKWKKYLQPKKYMEEQAEEAKRKAQEQADIELTNQNALQPQDGEQKEATTETSDSDSASKKKKEVRGGRKSLSVSRQSGAGINI